MANSESATLGGGCFWCLEAVYQEVRGVTGVESGYAGGHLENPTYEEVCSGATGHAEVVRVDFDPSEISYEDVLRVFFSIHDPTTVDRQGADVGPQYRSIILYHEEAQRQTADRVIAELEAAKLFDAPIVTQLEPLEAFFSAEEYHRDYFRRNPDQAYCSYVIAPKVAKFRKQHVERLRR
jgi:peptide-methionine (S)-S-oxide reductase